MSIQITKILYFLKEVQGIVIIILWAENAVLLTNRVNSNLENSSYDLYFIPKDLSDASNVISKRVIKSENPKFE